MYYWAHSTCSRNNGMNSKLKGFDVMDNSTLKTYKERGLNSLQLRLKREQIYRRKVPHNRVLPQAKGRVLLPASDGNRVNNFLKFVDMYFSKKIDNIIPDPDESPRN